MNVTELNLEQFSTGTENYYRHPSGRGVYTDGVKYLAGQTGSYWLIDDIMIYQMQPEIAKLLFQVWKLQVNLEDSTAKLLLEDGNYNELKSFDIPFTDFPLEEAVMWFINGVLLLPVEY